MTIVVAIPSAQYTPRTITRNFTLAANTSQQLVLTLTRESWPDTGTEVVEITVAYPDGRFQRATSLGGTTPPGSRGDPNVTSIRVPASFQPGEFLPAGQYTATARIITTLTTAVTVERF